MKKDYDIDQMLNQWGMNLGLDRRLPDQLLMMSEIYRDYKDGKFKINEVSKPNESYVLGVIALFTYLKER